MKKLFAVICVMLMIFSLAACGTETATATKGEKDSYVIGICQYMPHPALDQATQGFKDALMEEFGDKVTFEEKNAGGDISVCNTSVNSLVSAKVDLIMANATPAVAAAYGATSVIPILGTSVTEYGVALGIENFNGLVGANVSGTSDLADLEMQAQMIIEWCPDAANVGLLYCSTEANSKYQVEEVERILTEKGLTCKQFAFADTADMNAVVQSAADWSDVIYVPTDNTCATYASTIDGICRPAGVPIIAGEQGICSGCGIATLSIDYYDLGVATGKMAIKILKGEAKIEEMPIEYAPEVTKLYNAEICAELGIEPLEGYVAIEE